MTPNLTELMQRVEEAMVATNGSLKAIQGSGPPKQIQMNVVRERELYRAFVARLLSVIRCPRCGGSGTQPAIRVSGSHPKPCELCSPDRAAIEKMK